MFFLFADPAAVGGWDKLKERLTEIEQQIRALLDEQSALFAMIAEAGPAAIAPIGVNKEWVRIRQEKKPSPTMRLKEVLALVGKTKCTVYRWMDDPDLAFPRPEIVRGVAVWDAIAVENWWTDHCANTGRWPSK